MKAHQAHLFLMATKTCPNCSLLAVFLWTLLVASCGFSCGFLFFLLLLPSQNKKNEKNKANGNGNAHANFDWYFLVLFFQNGSTPSSKPHLAFSNLCKCISNGANLSKNFRLAIRIDEKTRKPCVRVVQNVFPGTNWRHVAVQRTIPQG